MRLSQLSLSERLEILRRRRSLSRHFKKPCILIVDAAPLQFMGPNHEHRYRQDSNFHYFTGFPEPNSCFVMLIHKDFDFLKEETVINTSIFVQPIDEENEIWNGERVGPDRVARFFNLNSGYSILDLPVLLKEWILNFRDHMVYYYSWDDGSPSRNVINKLVDAEILKHDENLFDLTVEFHKSRYRKTPEEVDIIRKACEISALGHIQLMKSTFIGMSEFQLDGLFTGYVMTHGCARLAYPSIVGSGINGTILHYDANKSVLKNGDLVLVDAGGEYRRYSSDITRVWPVNGKFSAVQREVYGVVLQVQKACINFVRPGMTWQILGERAAELLTLGMMKLGLIKGNFDDLMKYKVYQIFCPHNLGHWLGLDVHDCSGITEEPFLPGCVLTIEPGIYVGNSIGDDDDDVANAFVSKEAVERYRGIGIRIEDDILVTEEGCEVLSRLAPKEIDEIEKLVGQSHKAN